MQDNVIRRTAFALMLLAAGAAFGRGPADFDFPGHARLDGADVLAAWNPHDRRALLAPGPKVVFFGSAPGCDTGGGDGRMAHPDADAWAARARSLSGVAPGAPATRWVPSGDTPGCAPGLKTALAESFVTWNPAQGVGLYTVAGPSESPGAAFFGTFGAGGQNGQGANQGVEGTFVTFRQEWHGADAFHPFDSGAPAPALQVRSRQGVAVFRAQGRVGDHPVQTKQQIAFTLINEPCMQGGGAGRVCQLKFLVHTAIYRDGVNDWSTVGWFRNANVLFDPAQGGIPVIQGPLGGAGELTADRDFRLPLYRSIGSATRHGAFDGVDFGVEITWAQWRDALRMVAGLKLRAGPSQVSDERMAEVIGPRWQDPSAWALLDVNVGQEVSNRTPDQRAYIGGNFSDLRVSAAQAGR